jgi:hypothetical protein
MPVGWLVTGLIAAILVISYVWYVSRRPFPDIVAISECRSFYDKAASKNDSARVDRTLVPVNPGRGTATQRITCGVLRAAGDI